MQTMLTLLRSARGFCSRCHLAGNNFSVEDDDGRQRLLCAPYLQELEPDRKFPEAFARGVVPAPRDGWRPPPMAGSAEEYAETARALGFSGGLGGTIGREE